jgi:hypothetical protein
MDTTLPPLAVDVDGTLTRPGHHDATAPAGVDPRVFDPLREWPAPVVVATGKAFPYPVALCQFVGLPERVVAENGGVVYAADEVVFAGDAEAARAVLAAFEARGGQTGWGVADTVNRWRETEVAVSVDADETLLRAVAAEHDMTVVDTGYAYHVVAPDVDKGVGLRRVAELLDREADAFVAVGDSENDVPLFEVADRSYAVANAAEVARSAADRVLDGEGAEGFLAALSLIRERHA